MISSIYHVKYSNPNLTLNALISKQSDTKRMNVNKMFGQYLGENGENISNSTITYPTKKQQKYIQWNQHKIGLLNPGIIWDLYRLVSISAAKKLLHVFFCTYQSFPPDRTQCEPSLLNFAVVFIDWNRTTSILIHLIHIIQDCKNV